MQERSRRPEFRDSWAEDEYEKELDERAPLTREQVLALREQHPLMSPWRVIAVQAAVGLVVSVLAAVITGRGAVGWSALYGAAAVVLPGALMVRGLTKSKDMKPGAAVFGFMFWEFIKIGVAAAMLVAAAVVVRDLSWPALLVAMVLCMKVNWLALLWQGRARARKKRS
ncbi:ATP synthase subunit I [Azohydromonas lata]|uniref:ATP synthase subunit I n=1 Tax=Azohydromonas lata TaxID=45677 RepID=A0ABU5IP59_9BURK|nr:ATP synthase subunit I [Azohydromonas lata]MDZ5460686.1 ATP synthase subunit I [Azohydromonas lata]